MKIAILNTDYSSDLTALKAIDSSTLSNGDSRCIDFVHYVYFEGAKSGVKPDNLTDNDSGRWIKRFDEKSFYYLVDDSYDFVANSATDFTSIENINKGGPIVCRDEFSVHFFMKEWFYQNKTWSSLTNNEKDIVIKKSFYTNFYDVNADTNKVTHLMSIHGMTQPQAIDYLISVYSKEQICISTAATRRSHTEGIMNIIGKYLTNDEALDFSNLTRLLMDDYERFALVGTQYSDASQEGIDDFINSVTGTAYETTGLAQQGYTINAPYTVQNLIDELSDYLIKQY